MKIRQIRNATLLVEYAGRKFLIDPMLAPAGSYPGFAGTARAEIRNPMVELPVRLEELIDVDAVIVTHLHLDHWDDAARDALPKSLPVFVQNAADAATLAQGGFADIRILDHDSQFDGIALHKTAGTHGSSLVMAHVGERMGHVCGIVFSHADEKTLYVAGDTVWNAQVMDVLARHRPDVAVVNAGDAQIPGLGALIIDRADIVNVAECAPGTTVIASHMEAINHCLLGRAELREFARSRGMAERILVPEDGETLSF